MLLEKLRDAARDAQAFKDRHAVAEAAIGERQAVAPARKPRRSTRHGLHEIVSSRVMPKRSMRLRKRGAGDAEQLGGAHLVALRRLHRVERELALQPRQKLHVGIDLRGFEQHLDRGFRGQFAGGAAAPRRRRDCSPGWSLPSGMSFGRSRSEVARTQARWMVFSSSRTLPGHVWPSSTRTASSESWRRGSSFLRGDFLQEILGEQADVLGALAQRRELDADDIQPVEQILAEGLLRDLLFEVLVRRRDDAHIGLQRFVAADAGEFALLQDAQDFALERQRHVADFVEEKRAAVALLEAADARAGRAGERAFLVAEEFALEQLLGNGRAVDRDEALRAARRCSDGWRGRPVPCRSRSRR